jgi:alpha-glucosidase
VHDVRGFQVFPLQGAGHFESTCFEDDGHTQACRDGAHGQWRLQVSSTADTLNIQVLREGKRPPVQDSVVLYLPASDIRSLQFGSATLQDSQVEGAWRRLTLKL